MIADVQPYPTMKDSGVAWLGEVPEHWEVKRLKHVCRFAYGDALASEARQPGEVPVFGSNGRVGSHSFPNTRQPCLVIGRKGSFGKVNFSSEPVFAIDTTYYVDPRTSSADIRWLYYLLGWLRLDEVSKDSAIPGLDREDAYQRLAPVPPHCEQAAIVRFLDYVDRRIRRYIRAKQKLIKLLEEQKQAIIHRAITRGLDPNVRLKPSGVEWLGDVPEHWEVRKLRQCGSICGGLTPSMADRSLWDGDVPWVTPKDMKRFTIAGASMKVSARALEITSLRLIPSGSVLLVVRGMILARRVPIARTVEPVTINQDMKAIIPATGVVAGYLAYRMDAAQTAFVPMIDEAGHGTKRFPTERWKDLALAMPPVEEQRQIARHLDQATAQVVRALNSAQQEIDLLREYRTRLIADVVTGKLDVREAAARLPDEAEESEPIDEIKADDDADEAVADDTDEVLAEANA